MSISDLNHFAELPLRLDSDGAKIYPGHSLDALLFVAGRQGIVSIITRLVEAVQKAGGDAFLVGGCVRDGLLGVPIDDIDLEIYGISAESLLEITSRHGTVNDVGRQFGILKVTTPYGDLDVALPRRESKIAKGHRGFDVATDPALPRRDAAMRRDFTINALLQHPLSGEIIDAFDGVSDLAASLLRVVSPLRFRDDPLRLLRAVQIAARFRLTVDHASLLLMQSMVNDLKDLPPERITDEWKKLLLKAERPSIGLTLLRELGVIESVYPMFNALRSTQQWSLWHPEGDVWTHTLLVIDHAAHLIRTQHITDPVRAFVIMLAALCHDLGKPLTTTMIGDRIHSHGHEQAGVAPTREFLETLAIDQHDKEKITRIVADHLASAHLFGAEQRGDIVSDGAIRKLARRIAPATLEDLLIVSEADHLGRGPFPSGHAPQAFSGPWLRERADRLHVMDTVPISIVQGRDLVAIGFDPSPLFGDIIDLADTLRDDRGMTREEILGVLRTSRTAQDALTALRMVQ